MTTEGLETLRRHLDVMAHEDPERKLDATRPGLAVTVSRSGGSGGTAIAKRVATTLGLPLFDREILEAVAEQSGWGQDLLERLDECVEPLKGAWLRTVLMGENIYRESYRRQLVNAILGISLRGGVVLGRGANLILADRPALRVRVCGSPDRCRDRVVGAMGCTPEEAADRIATFDDACRKFIRTLFDRDIDDPRAYDLVLNTDRLSEDLAVKLIVAAARSG